MFRKIEQCHDCHVKEGQLHKQLCDVATCTNCGGQRLWCDCPREHDNGEIPFFYFPNLCDLCGKEFNLLSERDICEECYVIANQYAYDVKIETKCVKCGSFKSLENIPYRKFLWLSFYKDCFKWNKDNKICKKCIKFIEKQIKKYNKDDICSVYDGSTLIDLNSELRRLETDE